MEITIRLVNFNRVLYGVAVARDITERERAEKALNKAHEELEQRVAKRTAEREKSRAALTGQNENLLKTYRELEEQTRQRIRVMEQLREKERPVASAKPDGGHGRDARQHCTPVAPAAERTGDDNSWQKPSSRKIWGVGSPSATLAVAQNSWIEV